jgi:7-cyano-7-deazaguanine reductase
MARTMDSPLGQKSPYISNYQPSLLFPIPRLNKRHEIHVSSHLPFQGADIWNGFEISWLNLKGKPMVAVAEFYFPCTSPNLIESKSFKLYLNSFNHSLFESFDEVRDIMTRDLSEACGAKIEVRLFRLNDLPKTLSGFTGACIDDQDLACDTYIVHPEYLTTEAEEVSETLYSDLLKSNCLVTGQPDWGSLQIQYTGKKISPAGLLKYIISFRNHNEFHEQCVERIFMDIQKHCAPKYLSVYARYTRRGGLDINPYRSNHPDFKPENLRLHRQ